MTYTYYGGYDDTISSFQGGIGGDVLYLPNADNAERSGSNLYIHGSNGGTLTVQNFYDDTFQYTTNGSDIWNVAIADFYGTPGWGNYVVYSDDVNVYIGNGATVLWFMESTDFRLDDTPAGKYFFGIKDIIALDFDGGNSLLWGDLQDNNISDGPGNSNLWGGWGGNDTLTGGGGRNTFLYNCNGGHDIITSVQDADTVWLFDTTCWDARYYYDRDNNVMHLYAGTGELEVRSGPFEPVYQFSDGSCWRYEHLSGYWFASSHDAVEDTGADIATNPLWGNANEFFGTAAADNIFVSRSDGNSLVFDTDSADTIHLYDTALSDIVATSVSDNAIAIAFNTGEVAMVSAAENVSPTFKLASGQSYVYNRETSSWREA